MFLRDYNFAQWSYRTYRRPSFAKDALKKGIAINFCGVRLAYINDWRLIDTDVSELILDVDNFVWYHTFDIDNVIDDIFNNFKTKNI